MDTVTTIIAVVHRPEIGVNVILDAVSHLEGVTYAVPCHPNRNWDRSVLSDILSATIDERPPVTPSSVVAKYVALLDKAAHDRSATALIRIVHEWTGWSIIRSKELVDRATGV